MLHLMLDGLILFRKGDSCCVRLDFTNLEDIYFFNTLHELHCVLTVIAWQRNVAIGETCIPCSF